MNKCLAWQTNHFLHLRFFLMLFFTVILFSCTTEIKPDILSPEERSWLSSHDGKIIIDRTSESWAPIDGIDKNGKTFGIAIDYYKLIEKKLGFTFEVDKPRPWRERIKRYKAKEIDVTSNIQKTSERSEYLLFTEPFIEINNVIIVRKDIDRSLTLNQMTKMKISITKDFAIHDYIRKNYSHLALEPVNNDLTALQNVSLKRTDAAVMNVAVASYLIEKNHITNLRIAGQSGHTNALCIASRKDWPILNSILNKGLSLITPEERQAISKKWIHLDWVPFYKNTSFQIAAAFLMIIFLMNVFWNTRLRKEVHERKRAEEMLSKSEKQYRLLFEHNISIMLLINPETGAIYDANLSACSFYGFTKETLVQMRISDINSLSEDEIAKELEKAKSENRSHFNFQHKLSDGTLREVEVFSGPITIDDHFLLCSVIHDISERKLAEKEREALIHKLKKALDEIKTLKGIVPICSLCKKIRNDKGYWSLIETYIEQHSEASFSHGMCPDCSEKLYGDEDWYIKMKGRKEK